MPIVDAFSVGVFFLYLGFFRPYSSPIMHFDAELINRCVYVIFYRE
jgi:hypothetical protein